MNTAAIFDMDGLIINSEPLWRKAEIAIFKEVSVFLTEDDCESTAGLRIDEVIQYWYDRFPWDEKWGATRQDIETKIIDRLVELVLSEGEALPGIPTVFEFFSSRNIPMAVASSSSYRIINAVLGKLNIERYFDLVYSAEDEAFGKPHPGIFITAAKKMRKEPVNCLVFEDSFNGVLAGLSARMKVIAVPESHNFDKPKFGIAHMKLASLTDFNELCFQQLI